MNIMNDFQEKSNEIDDRITRFFERFKISTVLRKTGATKTKGVESRLLVVFVFRLVFSHKNFYRTFTDERESMLFGKDAVYRLLGDSSVKWEELVPSLASSVIPIVNDLTSKNRRSALIIDDSPLYRDRSKKVELLSRCKDHSENRYYNGFAMLNMAWSDGVTTIPLILGLWQAIRTTA